MIAHASAAAQYLAGEDMFTGASTHPGTAAPLADELMTFEGQLTRNAELRNTTAADGLHNVPVVCFELKPIHSQGQQDKRTCYAQIQFTDATRHAAELLARRHKKGMVIKLASSVFSTRMVFPQAQILESYTPA